MRVVALKSLRDFWAGHPDAERPPLKAWFATVSKVQWHQPADATKQFRNASVLKNRRVVFNVKGNDCRVVAPLACNTGIVFVEFVGAHLACDGIDAGSVELE